MQGTRKRRTRRETAQSNDPLGVHPHTGPAPRVRSPGRSWRRHELWAVPAVAVAAIVLVSWDAEKKYHEEAVGPYSGAKRAIDTLQAFTGGIPDSADSVGGTYLWGRYLAVAVALYATLRVVMGLYSDRLRAWRVRRRSGHTIVAGLGESGVRAVRTYSARSTVVALTRDPLSREADAAVAQGAYVVWGDARTPAGLGSAGIGGARRLVCADDTEPGSYETALAALGARRAAGPRAGPLQIHVSSSTNEVARALSDLGLIPDWVSLDTFDLHELWARRLVEAGPLWRYGHDGNAPPTLLVVGSSRIGTALLLQAVRWWHFGARTGELDERARLRIHVVAPDADAACASFMTRHPATARSIELTPLTLDPLELAHLASVPIPPTGTPWAAYICADADDTYRLTVAERLGVLAGDRADGTIFVAISALGLDSRNVPWDQPLTAPGRPPIVGVGVDDRGDLDIELLGRIEALARTIHGEYECFMRDQGLVEGPALTPFDALDEAFRESNRRQAREIDAQLTAVLMQPSRLVDWDAVQELTPDAIEVVAALEHASWAEERYKDGWRFGVVRDDGAKLHPDLVEWSALAEERREIDRAFVRRRPRVLARVGEQAAPHPARRALARLVHDRYRTMAPDAAAWESLSDDDREATLAFVDSIPEKLLTVNRRIVDATDAEPGLPLDDAQIELLARAEHHRWGSLRFRQGWTPGPRRDDDAKRHPDLVSWTTLPEETREIDRELIRAIPTLLETVGLASRPIGGDAGLRDA